MAIDFICVRGSCIGRICITHQNKLCKCDSVHRDESFYYSYQVFYTNIYITHVSHILTGKTVMIFPKKSFHASSPIPST